eukprot:TRINITY_DN8931_c0_g1_i3.p1 TRINITY_DN8931_c0_g1~~TRINITY_DN8931_c0_g1_i3.p1  ORF type:complete len:142 (-),score=23.54 TRINITY_DN8931_c0_g1_i3:73-498(-)
MEFSVLNLTGPLWVATQITAKTGMTSILVDARNHGNSPQYPEMTYFSQALDIKYLLDSKGLEKVVLIGHSMGGKVAINFALNFPTCVSKLVVVDVAPVHYHLGEMELLLDRMQMVRWGSGIKHAVNYMQLENIIKVTISPP